MEKRKKGKNFNRMGNKQTKKTWTRQDIVSSAPTRCSKALHDFINPLSNKIAQKSKYEQPRRDTPEPIQVVDILARDQNVHAPEASYDVHWQDDSSQDCEAAEDVRCLFLAFVH